MSCSLFIWHNLMLGLLAEGKLHAKAQESPEHQSPHLRTFPRRHPSVCLDYRKSPDALITQQVLDWLKVSGGFIDSFWVFSVTQSFCIINNKLSGVGFMRISAALLCTFDKVKSEIHSTTCTVASNTFWWRVLHSTVDSWKISIYFFPPPKKKYVNQQNYALLTSLPGVPGSPGSPYEDTTPPHPNPQKIISGAIQHFSPQTASLSCKVIEGNVQTYRFALVSLLSSDSLGGGERVRMRTSHGRGGGSQQTPHFLPAQHLMD